MRVLLAAALVSAAATVAAAQSAGDALVDRASAYVESFQRGFGSMVSEERYQQELRQAPVVGTRSVRRNDGPQETVLRSDFLLVQVDGEGWLPFRDVFERDGVKVRDRDERLAKIFLGGVRGGLDQARAIMNEGARYNIGNIDRNINVPTLVLAFLTPMHRGRFSFQTGKRDGTGAIIEFRETGRPTFIATTGGRDLPVSGRFWVDEQTGTIRKTALDAVDTGVEAHVVVTYQFDETAQLWVPAKMEERYRRQRDPVEVRGVATYSRFRRFQVSTSEEITPEDPAAPAPAPAAPQP